MIPNNNLSVLPWYTSINQQNARKWWIYNKIYPLFTPATFMLPFQVLREHNMIRGWHNITGGASQLQKYIDADGVVQSTSDIGDSVTTYNILDNSVKLKFVYSHELSISGAVIGAFYDSDNTFISAFDTPTETGTIEIAIPTGAAVVKFSEHQGSFTILSGGEYYEEYLRPITSFSIYTANGILVGNYLTQMLQMGLTVKPFSAFDYDVIIFAGQLPVFSSMANGQYYAVMGDGENTWYSEIFTVVNDITPYLKLEWWDTADFVMDAGRIVYTNPTFKNVLYLPADIAKPDYTFEDETEERDGYSFPTKQISKKIYHFGFCASEYLLDVMRFIRMSDYVEITYSGQRYSVDSFLITPEWENNGDVASVDAEFSTATVAKKIGLAYVKAQRGDFNNDFNDDYNND